MNFISNLNTMIKKLIYGEWWEITPTNNFGECAVINTHKSVNVVSGVVSTDEIIENFKSVEEAKKFLKGQLGFIKNITHPPSRDGFTLLYQKGNSNIIISIADSVLSSYNIAADNVEELLEQMMFEPLIESFLDEDGETLVRIDIDTSGAKAKGKIVRQIEEVKQICIKK